MSWLLPTLLPVSFWRKCGSLAADLASLEVHALGCFSGLCPRVPVCLIAPQEGCGWVLFSSVLVSGGSERSHTCRKLKAAESQASWSWAVFSSSADVWPRTGGPHAAQGSLPCHPLSLGPGSLFTTWGGWPDGEEGQKVHIRGPSTAPEPELCHSATRDAAGCHAGCPRGWRADIGLCSRGLVSRQNFHPYGEAGLRNWGGLVSGMHLWLQSAHIRASTWAGTTCTHCHSPMGPRIHLKTQQTIRKFQLLVPGGLAGSKVMPSANCLPRAPCKHVVSIFPTKATLWASSRLRK